MNVIKTICQNLERILEVLGISYSNSVGNFGTQFLEQFVQLQPNEGFGCMLWRTKVPSGPHGN